MSLSLQKNETINLTKSLNLGKGSNGLNNVVIGLGWDVAPAPAPTQKKGLFGSLFSNPSPSPNIDCDASVIVCRNGHYKSSDDLIYYGHLNHDSGAIQHCGDNLTGEGDGDDEEILINFNKLPADVDKIEVVVNIYCAASRHQHFGMIQNAFVRLVNEDTNQEICRYNLSENYDGKIAMIFGEFYKENNEWQFKAIGNGTNDSSVDDLADNFR